jgi:DNA polymerase-3 subunit epsilon
VRCYNAIKKQKAPRLEVSLIPANAWGRNVRAVVSEGSWYFLRIKFGAIKPAYSLMTDPVFLAIRNGSNTAYISDENYQENTKPLLCGGCVKPVPDGLHLHEKWEFDDENLIQKLVGFMPVCEDCHNAIHMGRSNIVGLGESAKEHLKKVNGWTDNQLYKHLENASNQWLKRIGLKYQLDLSWLVEEKLLSTKEIHLNWLNKPPRVYDRIGAISWAKEMLEVPDTVILDTETTGLMEGPMANTNAEIVELAIISLAGKVIYNSRFKPRYSIPQRTTEIHGITNQAVKNSPQFSKEYSKILQIITGKIVISYNARFDGKVLANTCNLHKLIPPEDVMWECAMKVYKAYQEPNTRFSKLPGGKHDALSDCKATLKLIKRMSRNEDIPWE